MPEFQFEQLLMNVPISYLTVLTLHIQIRSDSGQGQNFRRQKQQKSCPPTCSRRRRNAGGSGASNVGRQWQRGSCRLRALRCAEEIGDLIIITTNLLTTFEICYNMVYIEISNYYASTQRILVCYVKHPYIDTYTVCAWNKGIEGFDVLWHWYRNLYNIFNISMYVCIYLCEVIWFVRSKRNHTSKKVLL